MIDSKGLMIGNLVDVLNESGYISPDTGFNWIVNLIGTTTVGLKKGDKMITVQYKELSPITLTEDWLVKMGFENRSPHFDYKSRKYEIHGMLANGNIMFSLSAVLVMCKYVHELQNLVYQLFKKELTIKEVI